MNVSRAAIFRALTATSVNSSRASSLLLLAPTTARACSALSYSSPCASTGSNLFCQTSRCDLTLIRAYAADTTVEEREPELEQGAGSVEGKKTADAVDDPKDRSKVMSWEVSARYMKSEAYKATYGNDPVWKQYRRQHKGLWPKQRTRPTCIKHNYIVTGSPCPACRDEYLVLDYRNTDLLKQFISPYTGEVLSYQTTFLCQRRHFRLLVELEKSRYFGTMTFKVPFMHFDYADYYEPLLKQYNMNMPWKEDSPVESVDNASLPSQSEIKQ